MLESEGNGDEFGVKTWQLCQWRRDVGFDPSAIWERVVEPQEVLGDHLQFSDCIHPE